MTEVQKLKLLIDWKGHCLNFFEAGTFSCYECPISIECSPDNDNRTLKQAREKLTKIYMGGMIKLLEKIE